MPGRRALVDLPAAGLSLLLSLFVVVGASFNATDSATWFSSSTGAALGSLVVVLGLALVIYLPVRLLFWWLDRRWDAAGGPPPAGRPMRAVVRRRLWPTTGALLAGWLPWLLVHYPGNVDSDTITQLFQWLGLQKRSDHHPWFDTALFGGFWDLGHALGAYTTGLFVFLLLQEVLTALGVALTLCYLGRLGLSRWAHVLLTAFVAVFPTFVVLQSVMSKDSFAGIFWLPFLVLFVEAARTRGRFLMHPWVVVAAVAVVFPLIMAKRTNAYLVLVCVVVLVLVAARGTRWRILAGTGALLVVTNVVWPLLALPAMGVSRGTLTDMLSVPLQQTARTVAYHGDELPASERAAIDAVLGYDGLAKAYTPRRSDAVKGRWDGHATRQQQLAYLEVWLAELVRYPGTYVAATAANTFEYFAPVSSMTLQQRLVLDRYIDFWHSRSIEGTTRQQIADVADSLRSPDALVPAQDAMNRATGAFTDGNLLASKAFYASWVPLFALVFALRRRAWLHVVATVPMFLGLGVLVAGPIALPRYIIPMVLGAVLLVGLLLTPVRWERRGLVPDRDRDGDRAAETAARTRSLT